MRIESDGPKELKSWGEWSLIPGVKDTWMLGFSGGAITLDNTEIIFIDLRIEASGTFFEMQELLQSRVNEHLKIGYKIVQD